MYHYTESGLKNIWLKNGYNEVETSEGVGVSFDDIDGLHKAIGRALARKTSLTGSEFRFLRKELGLSQGRIAAMLGSTEQSVALWEKRGKIPKTADRMTKAIYLETIDGNVKLREMIERLVDLDQREAEKLVFEDTDKGWLPKAA